MKREIFISDFLLAVPPSEEHAALTFREKIETAKLLDKLGVNVIELGELSGAIADGLLIKSVAASVSESSVAVCAGFDPAQIAAVWDSLKNAKHPRLQVRAAVSTSRMEYVYHRKADAMLQQVAQAVRCCKALCDDVEYIADDATRADFAYLCKVLNAAIEAGASTVTVCDNAGAMLAGEFADFIRSLYAEVPALRDVVLGVACSDEFALANALAVSALQQGAGEIKTTATANTQTVFLGGFAKLLAAKADSLNVESSLRFTQINRILQSVERLCGKKGDERSPFDDGVRTHTDDVSFTRESSMDDIIRGAETLGYDLEEEDKLRIFKAFEKVAKRKERVNIAELEAIIAAEAMQVPATYTLENYVVTTGNAIDILAHIKLKKGNDVFDGLSLGDGPIDAAFLAIEQITGHHYELDDFQIQAVSEGREAMGQTIVKLRSGGKVYSGKGLSTDIIGSGVAAYVNALNKILYEEERG